MKIDFLRCDSRKIFHLVYKISLLLSAVLLVSGCSICNIAASGMAGDLHHPAQIPVHINPKVGDQSSYHMRATKVLLAGVRVAHDEKPFAHWTTRVTSVNDQSVEFQTVNQAGLTTRVLASRDGTVASMALVCDQMIPFKLLPVDGSDPRLSNYKVQEAPKGTYVVVPAGRFSVDRIIAYQTTNRAFGRSMIVTTLIYVNDEVPSGQILAETVATIDNPAFSWEKILSAATAIYFQNAGGSNPLSILDSLDSVKEAASLDKDTSISRTELISIKREH